MSRELELWHPTELETQSIDLLALGCTVGTILVLTAAWFKCLRKRHPAQKLQEIQLPSGFRVTIHGSNFS